MKASVNRLLSLLLIFSMLVCIIGLGVVSGNAVEIDNAVSGVTEDQENIVGWADYYYDITWTPLKSIQGWKQTLNQGSTYHLPYSQPVNTNGYIGYGISLEDFISATNDPYSRLYTDSSYYQRQSTYYGMDCASFVSLCWGVGRKTTATIPGISKRIGNLNNNIDDLEIGDAINYNGPGEFHVILVTDITRDGNGKVTNIEITEETPPELKRTNYTRAQLINRYYSRYPYIIYRYEGSVPPPPKSNNKYVDLGDDFYAYIINTAYWKNLINNGEHNACFSDTQDQVKKFWHFIRNSNGSYKIISVYDGQALDCDLGQSANGTNVGVWDSSDVNYQEWFIYGESARYCLRPNCSDGVLDMTGGNYYEGVNAQIFERNDTDAQLFQIWKVDRENVPINVGDDFYAYIINTAYWKNLIINGEHNACFSDTQDQVKKFWHFIRNSNGSYKIISVYDGQALDCDLGQSANGTNVGVWDSSDVNFQEWFIYGESARYCLRPNCSDGVLDMTGGNYYEGVNAQIFERNDTDAQLFQIWKVDREDVPINVGDDFYAYIINTNAWKSLANDGAHHAVFNESLPDNQKIWHFTRKETGSYKIKSVYDGNVLDVDLGKSESGTDVGVWTDSDTNNQEWYIYGESARYYFKPRCSDCVLDMSGGEYYDNVNAWIYSRIFSNGQLFQIWTLDKPNLIAPKVEVERVSEEEGNIKLTWNGCDDATGYDIRIYDEEGENVLSMFYNVQGTTFTTELSEGNYYAEVTALNNRFNQYQFGTKTSFSVLCIYYLGDTDGDGEVTIFDATAIQRHLADLPTKSFVESTADADGDGEVTIFDATYIQRWLANLPSNEKIGQPIK